MADTISALDTATTDELIAALVARHRATLGQACGHMTDVDAIFSIISGLEKSIALKIKTAIGDAGGHYVNEHPAWTSLTAEQQSSAIMRLLGLPNIPKSPPKSPPFGFGPFGRG